MWSRPCLAVPLFAVLQAFSAHAQEDMPWTSEPTHIDRSRQTYQRVDPRPVATDTRAWLAVPYRISIFDSTRFAFDGKTYRIDRIHPIDAKRICHDAQGARWPCGRSGLILLNNLVRDKKLLCNATPAEKETVLDNCLSRNEDIAFAILREGFGKTDDTGLLAEAQRTAQAQGRGIWRNPDCLKNFDTC